MSGIYSSKFSNNISTLIYSYFTLNELIELKKVKQKFTLSLVKYLPFLEYMKILKFKKVEPEEIVKTLENIENKMKDLILQNYFYLYENRWQVVLDVATREIESVIINASFRYQYNQKLRKLTILSNEKIFSECLHSFRDFINLEHLILQNLEGKIFNDAGDNDLALFCDFIQNSQFLYSLTLKHILTREVEITSIINAIALSKTIKEVYFKFNYPESNLFDLTKPLFTNNSLKKIKLRFDSSHKNKDEILKLCDSIRFTEVSNIDLSKNLLGDVSFIELTKVLAENTAIKQFSFSDNNIGSIGLENLALALKVNSCLEYLDLSYNPQSSITDLLNFLKAINQNSSLNRINISYAVQGYHISSLQAKLEKSEKWECRTVIPPKQNYNPGPDVYLIKSFY
jgi:hypothetical protein